MKAFEDIRWFHAMELGGRHTHSPEATTYARKIMERVFRHSVRGLSVLDIGAWDGLYSFEAERLGASKVLATDHFSWSGPGWGTKDGFDLAHGTLASKVESRDIPVEQLSPSSVGQWDVVLYLGVLYHSPNPLGDLKRVSALTSKWAVVETEIEHTWSKTPRLRYVHGDTSTGLSRDPTNFFVPNPPAMVAMLKTAGFARVDQETTKTRGVFHAFKA